MIWKNLFDTIRYTPLPNQGIGSEFYLLQNKTIINEIQNNHIQVFIANVLGKNHIPKRTTDVLTHTKFIFLPDPTFIAGNQYITKFELTIYIIMLTLSIVPDPSLFELNLFFKNPIRIKSNDRYQYIKEMLLALRQRNILDKTLCPSYQSYIKHCIKTKTEYKTILRSQDFFQSLIICGHSFLSLLTTKQLPKGIKLIVIQTELDPPISENLKKDVFPIYITTSEFKSKNDTIIYDNFFQSVVPNLNLCLKSFLSI